jgi:hypothetical protein
MLRQCRLRRFDIMPGATMTHRARFNAALGASGLAGLMIAALVAITQFSTQSGNAMSVKLEHTAHDHGSAAPLCRAPSEAAGPDFYSEMAAVNARMHRGMEVVPSGDIDRDFIRMMIPHHQGAVDMARTLLKYGRDEKLKRLAQSIIVEQDQEIAYMRMLDAAPASGPSSGDQPDHH